MNTLLNTSKHHIILIVTVSLCCFFGQAQRQRIIDSLLQITKTSKNDTTVMLAYDRLREITATDNNEKNKEYTENYMKYAVKINDSLQIAFANFFMGHYHLRAKQLDLAIASYLKSAHFLEAKNKKRQMALVNNAIGAVYEKKNELNAAITYYKRCISLAKEVKHLQFEAIGLTNLGKVYEMLNQLDVSLEYIEKAEAVVDEIRRTQTKDAIEAVGEGYISNTLKINRASVLLKQNKPQQAKGIYEIVLQEMNPSSNKELYGHTLMGLGRAYNETKETLSAENYLRDAYQVFLTNKLVEDQMNILPELIGTYQANKKNEKALSLFYTYNDLKDSISDNQKNINLNNALQKYEALKKDQEIAAKERSIIEEKAKRRNTIIGLVALTIVSLLVIFSLRGRMQYKNELAQKNAAIQKQRITELQQENKLLALNSMIEGQEAERHRIATDLHDSLGGLLSTVKAHFSAIQKQVADLKKLQLTDKTEELIDEACIEVRRISHNMQPQSLSLSGLTATLEDIAGQLQMEGYQVNLELQNIPPEMSKTDEATIYRIIQEAISNIRKHAKATEILIQLIGNEEQLVMTIEDNGVGLDLEEVSQQGGLGLKSIESRTEFLDGTLVWDSQPNEGTTLTISIPIVPKASVV